MIITVCSSVKNNEINVKTLFCDATIQLISNNPIATINVVSGGATGPAGPINDGSNLNINGGVIM